MHFNHHQVHAPEADPGREGGAGDLVLPRSHPFWGPPGIIFSCESRKKGKRERERERTRGERERVGETRRQINTRKIGK
jgi:hypothetical protein